VTRKARRFLLLKAGYCILPQISTVGISNQVPAGRPHLRIKVAFPGKRTRSTSGIDHEGASMRNVTFVLIPGAGGSAWYWHLVAPKLRQRGHEAIPVALPAADDSAGLVEYTAAVVRAVGARKSRRLVLVAQSLGGFTAPLVCEQLPVSLLVMVNAMIPEPGETAAAWWKNTGFTDAKRAKDRHDGRDPDAPFDPWSSSFTTCRRR